jgi:hypothetical protein
MEGYEEVVKTAVKRRMKGRCGESRGESFKGACAQVFILETFHSPADWLVH